MAPDLNSLPPSRSSSLSNQVRRSHNGSPSNITPAQHMPAPLHQSPSLSPRVRSSPHAGRRRSSLMSTQAWSLNETSAPPPGEPARHHERAPSLGELHQELENEQEAQVNRLLLMIRQQQSQIASLTPATPTDATAPIPPTSRTPSSSRPPSTAPAHYPTRNSASMSRQSSQRSRTSSAHGSIRDRERSTSRAWAYPQPSPGEGGAEWARDETSVCQVETAMVNRENQMLKGRIRELERLLAERAGVGEGE